MTYTEKTKQTLWTLRHFFRTFGFMVLMILVIAPAARSAYYNHMPIDHFIEVDRLEVEPVITTSMRRQEATLYRKMRMSLPGESYKELALIRESDSKDVLRFVVDGINFEKNEYRKSTFDIIIPEELEPGRYLWRDTMIVRMPNGTQRIVGTWTSNDFYVVDENDCLEICELVYE